MRHICAPVENIGAADWAFCVSVFSARWASGLQPLVLWQLCEQQFLEGSNACDAGERLAVHTTWLWR
jgi:hypothetical protein